MKGFNLFNSSRKCVMLPVDQDTGNRLYTYGYEQGINMSQNWDGGMIHPADFPFHVTIFYTDTYHNFVPQYDVEIEAKFIEFDMFGDNKDILVAKIESPDLRALRKQYEAIGMRNEKYPNFAPHVTISYNHAGPMPDPSTFPERLWFRGMEITDVTDE